MTARKVPAGHGWQWIQSALGLIKRQPVPFLVMGLILGIISIIPLLGSLVMLILGPALAAGICYAALQADQDRNAEIGHLFRGFQEGDRIGSLIALCIPSVVGYILIILVFGIFIGAALATGGGADMVSQVESNPMVVFSLLGAGALILLPLVIVVALIIAALVFFATPETLLGRSEAFANMKASFGACKTNFGAFIVALVILIVGCGIAFAILSLLPSVATSALVTTLFYAIYGPMLYFAWKDVFGKAEDNADSAQAAPPATATATPPEPPTAPPAV